MTRILLIDEAVRAALVCRDFRESVPKPKCPKLSQEQGVDGGRSARGMPRWVSNMKAERESRGWPHDKE
ncbi:MAG: hypothetical protein ACETV1_02460 [Candidatus Bathyarchaeia archaeon]